MIIVYDSLWKCKHTHMFTMWWYLNKGLKAYNDGLVPYNQVHLILYATTILTQLLIYIYDEYNYLQTLEWIRKITKRLKCPLKIRK